MNILEYRCSRIPGRPLIRHEVDRNSDNMDGKNMVVVTPLLEEWSYTPFKCMFVITRNGDVFLNRSTDEAYDDTVQCGTDAKLLVV